MYWERQTHGSPLHHIPEYSLWSTPVPPPVSPPGLGFRESISPSQHNHNLLLSMSVSD